MVVDAYAESAKNVRVSEAGRCACSERDATAQDADSRDRLHVCWRSAASARALKLLDDAAGAGASERIFQRDAGGTVSLVQRVRGVDATRRHLSRTVLEHRPAASRPAAGLLAVHCEAVRS